MSRQIRVLHVDDQPEFASLTADYLEQTGDRLVVETAEGTDEGLDRLDARIDCIVSDYNMPGTNGIEFLEAVREEYPDLPFILFTGKGSEAVASDAISAGVTDYLQKKTGSEQFELLANRITNAVEQYRATQAVEQTERRLHELAEKTDDVLWMYTADWGELLFINSPFEDAWGITPDDLREDPTRFLDQVHPQDRDRTRQAMVSLSNGESTDIEIRLDTDELRWVWIQGDPIYEDGKVVRVVGFTRDITERKLREQRLEHERDRFQTLFETLPSPVIHGRLTDEGPIVNQANPAFEETFGFDTEEIAGENLDDFVVPPEKNDEAAEINARIREIGRERVEIRRQTTDGVRDFRLDGVLTEPSADEPEGYAIYTDITDAKERERKLTALHDVAGALDSADSPTSVCERAVEASQDILEFDLCVIDLECDGYLEKEALSAEVPPENTTRMSIDEGVAGKTYRTGNAILVDDLADHGEARPQGPYQSAVSVPLGDHGVMQAVSERRAGFDEADFELAKLLGRHVTNALDRLERERQLERQNETLERFTEIVSHDLQGPLSAAHARADLVAEECDSDHLTALIETIERMDALIDDLSTIAHEDAQLTDLSRVSLSEVATRCWETTDTDGGTLAVETDLTVVADRSRLAQLLENLYRNAIDHGGDAITITVGELPDREGFYVADDGRGIPEDERDQIFESGYTTARDGTGLGLSIVEEVVEAHGWTVDVTESEAGGARFEISGVEPSDG
jgi:PAS domain S-box-containing protein